MSRVSDRASKVLVLEADLSAGKLEKVDLGLDMRKKYLGSRGINSKILYDSVGPEIDALSPGNVLVFGVGVFGGTPVPSTSMMTVTSKSHVCGFGASNVGGYFPAELRKAGFDHIVVRGKAEEPVYLWIDNGKAEIRSAAHLWGQGVYETNRLIQEELGDNNVKVTAIGQAGESLIRIANIMAAPNRASSGRTGAVMGSKNLKAIAVRGSGNIDLADEERVREISADVTRRLKAQPIYQFYRNFGDAQFLPMMYLCGSAPFNNLTSLLSEEVIVGIGPAGMKKYYTRATGCPGCPMPHHFEWEINDGPYAGERGLGMNGGVIMLFGNPVGVSYAPFLFKAKKVIDDYGLDGTETVLTIAAAIEWFEKGIITRDDLDGMELKWGDYPSILEMVHRIARRQGIGDLLAEGAVIAAEKIGKGAIDCISHCKGRVSHWLDWRSLTAGYLNEITTPSACEMMDGWPGQEETIGSQGEHWLTKEYRERIIKRYGSLEPLDPCGYNKKADSVVFNQDFAMLQNSLGICTFISENMMGALLFEDVVGFWQAVTGISDIGEEEIMLAARRCRDLERAFLALQGYDRYDDWLHGRLLNDPVADGRNKGVKMDPAGINRMLNEYYQLRGWDLKTGNPIKETLLKDGLPDVAEALEKRGLL